jgi:hypothetical protein
MSGKEGYFIDDFRSYDFFAGTKYSASVLRLLRRPKVLVLPIGPAGAGKSSLARTLTERCPSNTCLWWHRDLEFALLRNNNVSMSKSKSLVHSQMLSFLKGDCKSIRIVDSTNGNAGARRLYAQEANPGLIIFAILQPSIRGEDEHIIKILLERTRDRLEDGTALHPSFPTTVHEQRNKHEAILKGIEYPTSSEMEIIGVGGARKVYISCDPFEESNLSSLPFNIFLEYSVSICLNNILKRSDEKSPLIVG